MAMRAHARCLNSGASSPTSGAFPPKCNNVTADYMCECGGIPGIVELWSERHPLLFASSLSSSLGVTKLDTNGYLRQAIAIPPSYPQVQKRAAPGCPADAGKVHGKLHHDQLAGFVCAILQKANTSQFVSVLPLSLIHI
eukprot:1600260-Amphidinium_carterae.1